MSDYLNEFILGGKVLKKKVKDFDIAGFDLSNLANEVIRHQGFNISLRYLNLSCHVIERMKQKGFDFDVLY